MFARLVKSHLKPNHLAEFSQTFDQQVIPMLRKSKGFRDAMTLVGTNPNEAIAITLWDSKESAEAYHAATYPEVLKIVSSLVEGTPEVKTYEVKASTFEKHAAHAAV